MQNLNNRHKLYLIALPFIIAYLIFFSACLNESPKRIAPRAIKGVLDLSDWDLQKDGPVDLIGEYEFYWMQHLMPEDFSKTVPGRKTEFIKLPEIANSEWMHDWLNEENTTDRIKLFPIKNPTSDYFA